MLAYQCDRCKKYFNEKDVDGSPYPYITNKSKTDETKGVVLDLCPACKEKLISFINVKENA